MSQLHLVILLCLLKLVAGLTDSEKLCVANNAGTLDNEFMIGDWYEVYKFSAWLNQPASPSCAHINITRANTDDVERYKAAHGAVEPFQFDNTAVLFDRGNGYYQGMLTGGEQVKFFAWDPKSVFFRPQAYEARVYKKINDDYMLYYTCSFQVTKWLLSRKNNPTEEELKEVIATIDEVSRLETQRFCA